jgi:hypothetical protein
MKTVSKRRLLVLASVLVLGFAAIVPARGDEAPMVDSPQYAAWAKFKPDSSSTLSADMKMGPNTVHVETTTTLKSVTPEKVEVQSAGKMSFMGHDNETPVQTRTIAAKEAKQDKKDLGEQDVAAMGKTFKCKVYEITGANAGAPSAHGGAGADAKATIYVSDDVPGGLVKMDIAGANGQKMTFTLTAMDSK